MGDRADDPAAAGLLGANVELGDEDRERGQMLEGGAEGFKCRRVDVGEGKKGVVGCQEGGSRAANARGSSRDTNHLA